MSILTKVNIYEEILKSWVKRKCSLSLNKLYSSLMMLFDKSYIIKCSALTALAFSIMACNNHERLNPSGVNTTFDFDTKKPFEDYVDYSIQLIEKGRADLGSGHDPDKIVSWNAPFALYPSEYCPNQPKKGILVIHGLTDSPYTTRGMAEYFNNKCFTVYSILLAGHGTRPGDLIEVSYESWIKQVNYGIDQLSKKVDEVYIGGFSTGGALAINYVLSNPNKEIAGVLGFSPALKLPSMARLIPFVSFFKTYLDVFEDQDIVKYESFPMNAAAQIYKLTEAINAKLETNNARLRNTKIFAVFTYQDQTIDPEGSIRTLINNSSGDLRHIMVFSQSKVDQDIVESKGVSIAEKEVLVENKKIVSQSHISFVNRPSDPWYGQNGTYRNCLHYFNDKENYDLCAKSSSIYLGEKTDENLNKWKPMARLTFNPKFNEVFSKIWQFFNIK